MTEPSTDDLLAQMVSVLRPFDIWYARAVGATDLGSGRTAREAMLAALELVPGYDLPNADLF